jgi:hypothetical protein
MSRLCFFSKRFTVAFDETPFKKLIMPKQYKLIQNIARLTELICSIMTKHKVIYPPNIHLPTGILLNTLVESNIPVIAPKGESNNDKPRLPSEKPSLYLIPGMEATHVPNKRLDVENRKPTASAGLFFIKVEMFLIIKYSEILIAYSDKDKQSKRISHRERWEQRECLLIFNSALSAFFA